VSQEGIITDRATGLEWYAGPNRDTTWREAKTWVDNLSVDGGGWRMPNIDELDGLYSGREKENIHLVFKISDYFMVWSSFKDWYLDCSTYGGARESRFGGGTSTRALAVRSQKP
jgi:hypothetical protein